MTPTPIRILRIAAGGDGVGRLDDGRTVFIPRTAPGDLVEPSDVRLHARFARARLGRLLEPGPDRITPACPHYVADQCGGCQLQHLSDPAQQAARRAIVGDALRRIARLDLPDPPLEPASSSWGYRTRVTLAVDGRGRTGFHPLGRPEVSFELTACPVAVPELNRLWESLRARRDRWPSGLRQVGLRREREGRLHVILAAAARPDPGILGDDTDGAVVCLWWATGEGVLRPVGPCAGTEAFPAAAFEQVHPAMGDRVRAHAIAQLGPLQGRHVWDLYAGIGEATAALARSGATVESVELDPGAVLLAERRGPGAGVRRYTGRVEDWVGRLDPPASVYCNPPRGGLGPDVTSRLAAAAAGTIVYVSCDPATLARDLVPLTRAGYRVGTVAAFDLFPQTAHVETVVRMERG